MQNAAPPLVQVPLSSFLGLYTEAAANDLPEGASPLNWDCDFIIGSVKMRPGIGSAFTFGGGGVTGPDNCGTGANVSLGLQPWTNPTKITALDGQYASVAPLQSGSPSAFATAAADIAVPSGVAWTNPTNAEVLDGLYAVVSLGSGNGSLGPNNCGAGADVSSVGSIAWTNPNNIASAGQSATATLGTFVSHYLQATNFGFAVPPSATILGISASITKSNSAASSVADSSVKIVKAGTATGTDHASATAWSTVATAQAYGGSNDLWGVTWLPSDINNSGFGIAISAKSLGVGSTNCAVYAFVAITVFYSVSNGTPSDFLQLTSYGFSVPIAATISGVQIKLTGLQSQQLGISGNVTAALINGGAQIGNAKTFFLPTSAGLVTLGSSSDLWGAALTGTIVDSATFGVQIQASTPGGVITFSVDAAQIQVFYSFNGSDELLASNFGFAVAALAVQGITVGLTGHQTGSGIITAQLSKNGVLVGQTRTVSLTASDSRVTLGGNTDNWGAGLVFSDVNNPAFGIAITASGGGTFFIDLADCTISQVAGSQNFNYVKTYAQRNGQVSTLALDNSGTLWQENVTSNPGQLSSFFTGILPNMFGKSVTLDDVEYLSLSDLQQGVDMPRQWNGVNVDRISQVGPGAPPSVNFTSNAVSLTALTQAATFTLPTVQNGTWILWSDAPNSHNVGNILTFVFPSTFTLPAGFTNGAYVAVQNLPSMGGFNPNSGAVNGSVTNPNAYLMFNVGGPIQGQSSYSGFSVLLLQSGFANNRVSGGTVTLQLTLATATATAQVPNVQVGSQFVIAGVTPAGWNNTWTCLSTPNAGQYQITNTSLASNVATYSFNLISGSNPSVGQQVQVTGTVNGNGIFNRNGVVQSVGAGFFTLAIQSPNIAGAGENGQGIVNGTIFTFEPQKVVGNGTVFGTISTSGAIGAGSRACVYMYLTRNGYITAPSPYVQFSTNAGATSLVVSNLLPGPSNVIARIVAFTGAQVTQVPGQIGNFFYLPTPVTVFDPVAGQNVTYTATIIPDNTTTQATFTFTDAVLLAASGIDIQGNNLFEQKELGPTLGCIQAFGRMFHWGELNKVTNFINMSFDGGAGINSTAGNSGVAGTDTTYPLGWTPSDTFGSVINNAVFGQSYYIKQTGATTPIGMIVQSAYRDQYGVNILNPQVTYSVRINARTPSSATVGQLVIDLFSPAFGGTFGKAIFNLSAMTSTFAVLTSTLLTSVFVTYVPTDLQIRVYATNLTAGGDVELDRIEVFPTTQAVRSTNVAASYVNNFEAYDQVTGNIDLSIHNNQPIRSAFTQGETLYFVKTGSFEGMNDNGTTEPNLWGSRQVSNSVGTPSVNGVDYVDNPQQGEQYALIAGRSGVYLFNGGEPMVISGEIRSLWNLINWQFGHTLWIRNDQVNRRVLVGVPLATPNTWLPNAPSNPNPTTPNVILAMSYKELNSISDLADRPAVRTSFTGKLIAPEISRKWSIWQIQAPYADFVTRQNNTGPLFLGNSKGTGKIYQLTEGRTNDDGAAINETYTTYGWIRPDLDQALQLGMVRKWFGLCSMVMTGSGKVTPTCYPDSLTTKYPATLLPLTLAASPEGFDVEFPLDQTGARLFVQFSVNSPGDNFQLSEIKIAMTRDIATPVRGR